MYRPKEPFTTPFFLMKPEKEIVLGLVQKSYTASTEQPLWCSWKSFGGTEKKYDQILAYENTAVIDTWWNPDFKNDCQIQLLDDGSNWEILNIENIQRRNQFAKIKIKLIGGAS